MPTRTFRRSEAARLRPRVAGLAALALGLLGFGAAGCVGYDQRVCDDPDPTACDPRVVQPRQRLRDFRQDNPDPAMSRRPVVGSAVDVRSVVVTAVDTFAGSNGKVGDMWIQERVLDPAFQGCAPHPDGGRVCGVQLFGAAFVPAGSHALPGDLVNVTGGRYDEFDCTPCCAAPRPPCRFDGRTLPELSFTSVERIGSASVPAPVPVTLQQIATGGDAYVGVLVRVTDVVVVAGAPDTRGEMDIGMGVKLTSELTALNDPSAPPDMPRPLAQGQSIQGLTGIVSYFFGTKLLPRSLADIGTVQ